MFVQPGEGGQKGAHAQEDNGGGWTQELVYNLNRMYEAGDLPGRPGKEDEDLGGFVYA